MSRAAIVTVSVALMFAGCTVAPGVRGEAAADPPASAASGALSDARLLDIDTLTGSCAADHRLAVVGLDDGKAFWSAFPGAPKEPEIEGVTTPLIAVAYDGGWPGGRAGVPVPNAVFTPHPGTWDVCVETGDGSPAIAGQSWIVYGSVPQAESVVLRR
jgi:hypothetical protein